MTSMESYRKRQMYVYQEETKEFDNVKDKENKDVELVRKPLRRISDATEDRDLWNIVKLTLLNI